MERFLDRVVAVTGGSSGIGAAVAKAFLQEGAQVTILDIVLPDKGTADENMTYDVCDVSDESSVEAAFSRITERCRKIDIVVHSAAALGASGPIHEIHLAEWKRLVDINLTGSFLVCRAAATRMIGESAPGRIILIGSVNSFAAERNCAPYASSKGGVRLLTRAAAVDLAPYGITVNMIAPGPITTPATRSNFESVETKRTLARVLPVGQPGEPEDVAAAVLFLASAESRFVTGTDLVVDGGMFAQILN